jgi:FtsP/CotA-like multicopper oxidase with cupredoxin domain
MIMGEDTFRCSSQRRPALRYLAGGTAATALMLLQAPGAHAQAARSPTPGAPTTCNPIIGQPFVPVPEIVTSNGVLSGTILLSDQEQRLAFREPTGPRLVPGRPGLTFTCYPQHVRMLRDPTQPGPPVPPGGYANPMPGPTLRARVGDIVQLAFLNQITVGNFPYSIDVGEKPGGGCDVSRGEASYPGSDVYPDCFHGSSTGNIHFHGTHTNPNATGDNVFIEVRPSPRVPPGSGDPIVNAGSVKGQFADFFTACAQHLGGDGYQRTPTNLQWPTSWNDAPLGPWMQKGTWTNDQSNLLQQYEPLRWQQDQAQIDQGRWPQYYVGAFPYCFRLPEFTAPTWSPDIPGMPPQPGLRMGQAPGTHWYHAHKHGSTFINVANGMTGAFIVEGKYDDELNAFYGQGWARTQPVMVINQLGVSPNLMRGRKGFTDRGPDFSVNGALHPVLEMQPGQVKMWRIANTSARSGAYFIGPSKADETSKAFDPTTDFQWRQLAQDGVQFNDANYRKRQNAAFLLAPGNRADLLVKAPTTPGTYTVQVKPTADPSDLTSAYRITLLTVNVGGPAASGSQSQFIPNAPSFPPFLADISAQEVVGTKKIVFASNGANFPTTHTIDGQQFGDQVGAAVLLNKVEEWKVVNETYAGGPTGIAGISHPFHIHINPFQVVEVFAPSAPLLTDPRTGFPVTDPDSGVPYPKYVFDKRQPLQTVAGAKQCYIDPYDRETWKPCDKGAETDRIWWDVFPIPSGNALTDSAGNPLVDPATGQQILVPGYFKMRSRFVDFPGYYVMHCHILAHEDRGMMTIVQVVPLTPPVTHH